MLSVRHLNAFYGDGQILFDLNIDVPDGGRVAIMGRNGAGKSTLFKSILNAGPRAVGVVEWNSMDLGDTPSYKRARQGLSLVPEDRRIFPHLTVHENLLIAQSAAPRTSSKGDVDPLLAAFPMLDSLRDRFGGQLSGGQQQMLAVARGFAAQPRLLLLDEPTEGLAPIIVQQLARSVVEACNSCKSALLLCEQNLTFARQCTERLYVIDSGHIVFQGDWSGFDRDPRIRERYLAV